MFCIYFYLFFLIETKQFLLCFDPLHCRRPTGVPEQDVCSDLVSYYKKQEEYMRIQLKKLQKENAGLAQKVQTGRENITHTEQRVASGVEEWRVREKLSSLRHFHCHMLPQIHFTSCSPPAGLSWRSGSICFDSFPVWKLRVSLTSIHSLNIFFF